MKKSPLARKKPLTKTAIKRKETEKRKATRAKIAAKKKQAWDLAQKWRDIVFERAGRCCEVCGKGPFVKGDFQLQSHHIVKRAQSKRLQLDPTNGCAVCAGCHLAADRDPIRCMAIINEIRPGTANYLMRERRSTEKRTMEDIEVLLEQAWIELGVQ